MDEPEYFADTPGTDNSIIDFRTPEGRKLFEKASAPLKHDFDCTTGNLSVLLQELSDRAKTYGWYDGILDIDVGEGETINLVSNYGEITLEQVKAHVATYIKGKNRARQDSNALYLCLSNSLTPEAKKAIILHAEDYTVDGKESGPMFLKVLIRELHIDTLYTVRAIRTKLTNLDAYMNSVNSDVRKFIMHVRELLLSLHARGETTSDLLPNLFKGLKAAKDKKFVQYIEQKESDYDEGKGIDSHELMQLALNRYDARVEAGTWKAPYLDEEEVVALQAEIKALRNKDKKSNKGDDEKDKTKAKKGKKKRTNKPAWMEKAPGNGEPTKKTVKGEEYFWCSTHKSWGKHESKDCRKQKVKAKKVDSQPEEDKPEEKKLTVSKALKAVMEADSDDE